MKLKKEKLATESYELVSSTYWKCFQAYVLQNQEDHCLFDFFQQPQNAIFIYLVRFKDKHPTLVANMLVKWKCLYSEFSAILISSGMGSEYLKTSQAITQMNQSDHQQIAAQQLADDHSTRTGKIFKCQGGRVLECLQKQSYSDVQLILKPDQAVIEYSIDALEAPRAQNVPKTKGLFMFLASQGEPFLLELDHVFASIADWYILLSEPERTADTVRKTHEAAVKVSKLLFPKSVRKIIRTSGIKRLYLCSDGKIGMLPLELLPIGGKLLREICSLSYLSSCRELLRSNVVAKDGPHVNEPNQESMECIIFANPDFNLSAPNSQGSSTWWGTLCKVFSSVFVPSQLLSGTCASLDLLPDTKNEAEDVHELISTVKPNIKTTVFSGEDATLPNALQIKSPFILHFATHGFSEPKIGQFGEGSFWDNVCTGLYLAGANTFLEGKFDYIHYKASTGTLTSLAVSGIDLRDTRLVFISTCYSAVGSSSLGGAVNSLAQAFRAAGAQTVIATIWNTSDVQASILVKCFYEEVLKDGVAPSQALLAAKNKFCESCTDWRYWSSFICIGEDKPLFTTQSLPVTI